jgi:hypothetical protein
MSDRDRIMEVHDAIGALLDDGEIPVAWALVIDVAGADGMRYLAHRAGGGVDGSERPIVWTVLGMLEASVIVTRDQVREVTVDENGDDE